MANEPFSGLPAGAALADANITAVVQGGVTVQSTKLADYTYIISKASTVGANVFTLTNPSAITFPRFNADNTVTALSAANFRTAIGAGTGSGTVTSVAALTLGTTGTDLTSSVATGTTTPVITLNVPDASAANRGALLAADWSTFNAKQSALTFGTGVVTALAVNIGSAGAPVLFNGAGGTPSSLTLTNATGLPTAALPTNNIIRGVGATFGDTAGSALGAGSIVYFTCPFAGMIAAWNITVDAGTCTFDIWKIASGTAIPTVANTITAAALPAIASGTAIHSTTLTAWTTAVAANDIFAIQLKTVATAKYAELDIQINVS